MTIELTLPGGEPLRSLRMEDAFLVLELVDSDRATFERWLRWAGSVRSREEAEAFIFRFVTAEEAGQGFHLGIWSEGHLLGGVPCWSIDPASRVAEIGYWLAPHARGRGFASAAAQAVTRYLLSERGVSKVVLQCRVENEASRRVAEHIGGKLEGIREKSHLIGGEWRDHAAYVVTA